MQARVKDRDNVEYVISFEYGDVYIGIIELLPRITAHHRIHVMMKDFLVPIDLIKDIVVDDYIVMGIGYARSAADEEILKHIQSYKEKNT